MSNRNNYLCVRLPEELVAALADTAAAIAEAAKGDEDDGDGATGFEPMAPDGVHLTFCFLGPHAQRLKRDAAFHGALRGALVGDAPPAAASVDGARGRAAAASPPPPLPALAAPFACRPTRLLTFPPGKHNLLVAAFDELPAGVAARAGAAHAVAARLVHPSLAALNSPDWFPHVTLGKIRGPAAAHGRVVDAAAAVWGAQAAAGWPAVPCDGRLVLRGHALAQAPDVPWDDAPLL